MDYIDRLLTREGGFVNSPVDRGGPTNWGITKLTLSKFRGTIVTLDDVKGLSKDEARTIYQVLYVEPYKLNLLPPMIQDVMLDFIVMSGPLTAVGALQEILHVPVDHQIGALTIAAAFGAQQIALLTYLCRWRALMLSRIVKRDVSQVVFLSGWLSRVLSFLPGCEAYDE
jgi:lysozyme family protein